MSGRVSLSSEQLRRVPAAPASSPTTETLACLRRPIVRSLADSDVLFDPASSKATPR